MFALGMVQKAPCYDSAWFFGASSQYTHACYSDIPHLYQGRGFADGLVPYFDKLEGDMEYLEYPGADRCVHGGRRLAHARAAAASSTRSSGTGWSTPGC
jgi:hypothetical protein